MYYVNPQSPELKAYWKFNDSKRSNTTKDYTGNGNDAVSHSTTV